MYTIHKLEHIEIIRTVESLLNDLIESTFKKTAVKTDMMGSVLITVTLKEPKNPININSILESCKGISRYKRMEIIIREHGVRMIFYGLNKTDINATLLIDQRDMDIIL